MTTKKCTKGYSCGAACINKNKDCRDKLTKGNSELCDKMSNLIDVPTNRTKLPTHDLLDGLEDGQEGYHEKIAEL